MFMRDLVLQDCIDILSTVFENKVCAAWMRINEVGDIVDLLAHRHIAGFRGVSGFDFGPQQGRKGPSRHVDEVDEVDEGGKQRR